MDFSELLMTGVLAFPNASKTTITSHLHVLLYIYKYAKVDGWYDGADC